METDYIRYFLKVAELQSVSKAADSFNISQPSMSRIISQIEAECQVPLFDRKERKMILNEYGKVFRDYMTACVENHDKAFLMVRKMAARLPGQLNIGSYASMPVITACVSAFKAKYPETRFLIRTNNAKYPQYNIYDFDFFFFTDKNALVGMESVNLLTERFEVVVNRKHPIASQESVSLRELADAQWVIYDIDEGGKQDDATLLCMSAGFSPNIAAEVDADLVKMQLISTTDTVGIQPSLYKKIYEAQYPNLVFVPIRDSFAERNIFLGWKADKELHSLEKRFRSFVKDYFADPQKRESI